MSSLHVERPLGGKLLTPGFKVLLVPILVMAALVAWRMFAGLASVTNMNDGYPWGIWKPLNVTVFTGIAAGAYGVGILTYVFNRGQYHPLVRSAVLAGTMGYTLAGISVAVDLGRWWNLWVVFWPPWYNLSSVLLEVAICVVAYTGVLWVEMAPPILEKLADSPSHSVRAWALKLQPVVKTLLPFVIAMALLLPTMHQSSLGGLYMVAMQKLHPLWHTAWLPALFLVSCLTMGYGAVVLIEAITAQVWPRRVDWAVLAKVGKVAMVMQLAYVALRVADLVGSGNLRAALAEGQKPFYFGFFALELALFLGSAALLWGERQRRNPGRLFLASMLAVLAGSVYRFDTYLTAFRPKQGWSYFPSVPEILISLGFACTGIAVYVLMVKRFPILSGVSVESHPATARGTAAAGR